MDTGAFPRALSRRDLDAVIFDLDGVLTDTATLHARAWKRLFDAFLAERGLAPPFDLDRDYRRYVDGRPAAGRHPQLSRLAGHRSGSRDGRAARPREERDLPRPAGARGGAGVAGQRRFSAAGTGGGAAHGGGLRQSQRAADPAGDGTRPRHRGAGQRPDRRAGGPGRQAGARHLSGGGPQAGAGPGALCRGRGRRGRRGPPGGPAASAWSSGWPDAARPGRPARTWRNRGRTWWWKISAR